MNPKSEAAFLFLIAVVLTLPLRGWAQQVSDEGFDPPVTNPAYPSETGPRVGIDEAHHNFHTVRQGYAPFAKLLRNDGYRVQGFTSKFTSKSLKEVDILVIVQALAERNANDWSLPTLSAFEKSEIDALEEWVKNGGSLLLIAGHMPWPGAAAKLAERFDVFFQNGFASPQDPVSGELIFLQPKDQLKGLADCSLVNHPIFVGRSSQETIPSIRAGRGQAFRLRPGGRARELLILEGPWVLRFPVVAWEFSEKTPQVRADGMLVSAVAIIGQGRVITFGGMAAMLTAQLWGPERTPGGINSPDAKHNAQFVLNMLHWLSGLLPAE